MRQIIRILSRDQFPARFTQAAIECSGEADIFREREDAHARIAQCAEVVRRAVGGGVVEDEKLEVLKCLCENRRNSLRQKRQAVVN